jgi:Flp pilus assembly protein TadD
MKISRFALALTALALLAGCQGHGSKTGEGASIAKRRLDGLKAATEFQMAEGAFSNEDLEKAHKHVSLSIGLNGNVVRSHVLLGRIYMEMGNLEEAAKSFSNAEAIDGNAAEPQYCMGLLSERTARKEAALARYLKASELEPADASFALAAAEVMIDLGQLVEAKAFLVERLTQFENNAGIRQTLGHIAMIQGDVTTAVKEFTDARLLAPANQGIAEDLARALYETEQFSEAEGILSNLADDKENASRRDLKLMLANCLIKLDRPGNARDILLPLTQDAAGSRDVEAFIALGNVSFIMKDMVRVRQAASRIVSIAPKRPEGYLLRALHMRHAGDFANAEVSAKQATVLGGGSDAWTLLGMIQQEAGRPEDAANSFAKAAELGATRPTTANVPPVGEPN